MYATLIDKSIAQAYKKVESWKNSQEKNAAVDISILRQRADWRRRIDKHPSDAEIMETAASEIERLRKIEAAARALKFSAYPAHGAGFVMQVSGGNINDLDAALKSAE